MAQRGGSGRAPRPDEVTDEQGRRRFHGAFTGGFSAGYFNSVGSAEGWKPSTFSSSRSNRRAADASSSSQQQQQRPQDFMDAEDGLLSNELRRNEEFDTFGSKAAEIARKQASAFGQNSVIPGPAPSELIVVSSRAVGKELMSKMGWKEGQGTGRRLKHKHTVALPQGLDTASMPASALDGGTVTFAPQNTRELIAIPVPKADYYGIGFVPTHGYSSSISSDLEHDVYRMDDVQNKSKGDYKNPSRSFTRAASGFAVDDDVDDIYDAELPGLRSNDKSSSRLAEVDTIQDLSDNDDDSFGADKSIDRKKKFKLSEALASYVRAADVDDRASGSSASRSLEGFVMAMSIQEKPISYPSIVVPADYKPFHVFTEGKLAALGEKTRARLTLDERTRMLSESGHPQADIVSNSEAEQKDSGSLVDSGSSVFAMLSEQSRAKIKAALQQQQSNAEATSTSAAPEPTAASFRPMLTKPNVATSVFSGVSAAFKNRFTSATIGDRTEKPKEITEVPAEGLWSIDRNGETSASSSEAKLSAASATSLSNAPTSSLAPKRALAPRVTSSWAPHPLLCKRMNIPVPNASKHLPHYGQEASQTAPPLSREDDIFRQHIGQHLLGHPEFQPSASASMPQQQALALRDDIPEVRPEKPPVSLFKSIFEASSSDSDTDDESDSEINKTVIPAAPPPTRIVGPKKEIVEEKPLQSYEYTPARIIQEVQESEAPIGKIVFKKPAAKNGILTFESKKRVRGPSERVPAIDSHGKPSKVLSFMDEFEEDGGLEEELEKEGDIRAYAADSASLDSIQEVSRPDIVSANVSMEIALSGQYDAERPNPNFRKSSSANSSSDSSSSSSSSSSESSDSESDQSTKQALRHVPAAAHSSTVIPGAENIARFHDKLSAMLDVESRTKKESRKKEKKSKKDKKKKKDSKKERRHRDDSSKHRKSKKHHKKSNK